MQVYMATEEFQDSERYYRAALEVHQSGVIQAVSLASKVNPDHTHQVSLHVYVNIRIHVMSEPSRCRASATIITLWEYAKHTGAKIISYDHPVSIIRNAAIHR
jgi:hypothetical protein